MKKVKVRVLAKDIKAGIPENASFCPIARAVRRLGYKKAVRVGSHSVEIGNKFYDIPGKATEFVEAFDYGEQVKPFTFTMEAY